MKKSLKPLMLSLILLGFMAIAQISMAQSPAPPPPSGPKGGSGNKGPGGGGAPIEGGVIVTLAMVAGFGAWKLYRVAQKKNQSIEN